MVAVEVAERFDEGFESVSCPRVLAFCVRKIRDGSSRAYETATTWCRCRGRGGNAMPHSDRVWVCINVAS